MGRPFKVQPTENSNAITSSDTINTELSVVETSATDALSSPIPGLPNKPTFRVSEVAAYFDVSERAVYLWIEHGHLKVEYTPAGQKRITRESINTCRFRPKTHVNNLPE